MDYKDFLPYVLGIISTVLALKKDWITSKFSKKEMAESVETQQIANEEAKLKIYRDLLDDLQTRYDGAIKDLRAEIIELQKLVREQKDFIAKQSKSLVYYEKKYGKITE